MFHQPPCDLMISTLGLVVVVVVVQVVMQVGRVVLVVVVLQELAVGVVMVLQELAAAGVIRTVLNHYFLLLVTFTPVNSRKQLAHKP